ncbi:MAG: hypothetical protein ACUVSL_15130 [Chloroflexus sp.]
MHERGEITQHPRDRQGERRDPRLIVSTAAAAAWLPHAKQGDTRMTSGQGSQSSG